MKGVPLPTEDIADCLAGLCQLAALMETVHTVAGTTVLLALEAPKAILTSGHDKMVGPKACSAQQTECGILFA